MQVFLKNILKFLSGNAIGGGHGNRTRHTDIANVHRQPWFMHPQILIHFSTFFPTFS
jgi:hypothetical protein